MIVKPFAALRPQKKYVKECAALPYDVMSSEEAREEVKGKPYSFLHIDRRTSMSCHIFPASVP